MSGSMEREPCPWRIVDDAGGAFCFGIIGGSVWHTFGGLRNAPKGHRISQAIARVQVRAPITAGSFAIWGTLFSCFDCSFSYIRKKEDPWNAIMSGAATGGLLAARAGMKAAGKNALIGGVILAAIEGLNIVVSRVLMPYIEKRQAEQGIEIDTLDPPLDPSRPRFVKHKPLWEPEQTQSPLYQASVKVPSAPAPSGFDLDTVSTFDPSADNWERRQQKEAQAAKEAAAANQQKPFWKVW